MVPFVTWACSITAHLWPPGDPRTANNIVKTLWVTAQHFAKSRDVHRKIDLLDQGVTPDFFKEFVLREKPPTVAYRHRANSRISFSIRDIGAFRSLSKGSKGGPNTFRRLLGYFRYFVMARGRL